MIGRIYDLIDAVRDELAPDPRISIFEVDVDQEREDLVLFGAVSVPAAVEELHRRIAVLELRRPLRDEVVRLPQAGAGDRPYGIVTAAIAPVLAGPLISESHLTQLVLGSRVTVLREYGRWSNCRASDGYLGWIHRGYLRRVGELEARAWEIGASTPIAVSLGAEVIDEAGGVKARLPWGARFGLRGETAVLPDGREGLLRGSAVPLADLGKRFPPAGESVVRAARIWSGAPYLWGGITPWGVDCSGLVQAIYRLHGIELPRDSDQQVATGDPIPIDDGDSLRPGDLLYFAERQDRISHVAISTGGWGIIHSAVGNGGVQENDLEAAGPYERELRSLLVAARRVIEVEG
jgi:gamma-D-glutamyl-L-lysine dipeptidyl-peptidase